MESLGIEFSKKHLYEALRKAGLPATRMSVLNYERQGVLLKPKKQMHFADKIWSFYTKEEIDESVARVADFVKTNKKSAAYARYRERKNK